MQLFCQSCQAAFAATSHCPRCGNRLLSPQESFIHNTPERPPPPDPIPSTFTNRLLAGVLVAMAMVFGLRELAGAAHLAQGLSVSDQWTETNLEPTTLALRVIAVIIGGLVAGAGRREGFTVGAMTGLVVGLVLCGIDIYAAGKLTDLTPLMLAGSFVLAAAIAGSAGAWIWPADAILPEVARKSSHGSSLARLAMDDAKLRETRPIAWIQIAIGAIVVMVGIIASDPIRLGLSKFTGGIVNTGGMNRAPWIGLQIGIICTLLGGIFSGMGTSSGFRQGLLASILALGGLLLAASNRENGLFPAVEGYLKLLDLPLDPLTKPQVAVNVMIAMVPLMVLSGWLGSQLFPPLGSKKMRQRTLQRQT